MGQHGVIRGIGIAVAMLVLGALGYRWFLQVTDHQPQPLQASFEALETGRQETEQSNARLRTENQRLTSDDTALQTSLIELDRRVAALEDTKGTLAVDRRATDTDRLIGRVTALEDTKKVLEQVNVVALTERVAALEDTRTSLSHTVESIKKQLDTSGSRHASRRIEADRQRLAESHRALRQNRKKLEQERARTRATSSGSSTLQSLAKDELALLLVTFLATHEHHDPAWFKAAEIQSIGGRQEAFALFNYHSWRTLDAKLREMERLELVAGRADAGHPQAARQYSIRHSTRLTTFQTLAANDRN